MEDNKIINLLFNRSEEALEELQEKYGRLILKVAMGILNDTESSMECENDTYLAVWKTIPPNRPSSLKNYVCCIAKRNAIKIFRHEHSQKRSGNIASFDDLEEIVGLSSVEDDVITSEIASAISNFLKEESYENRMIWMAYYWNNLPLRRISALLGMTTGSVKTRLSRMRKDLKERLIKEGLI